MTETNGYDWITFHRLRFPEPVSSIKRVFPSIAGPDCWLFGPHYAVGPDGMLTGVSDIWGGVGIWHSRDAAEMMIAAPGDAMPWRSIEYSQAFQPYQSLMQQLIQILPCTALPPVPVGNLRSLATRKRFGVELCGHPTPF